MNNYFVRLSMLTSGLLYAVQLWTFLNKNIFIVKICLQNTDCVTVGLQVAAAAARGAVGAQSPPQFATPQQRATAQSCGRIYHVRLQHQPGSAVSSTTVHTTPPLLAQTLVISADPPASRLVRNPSPKSQVFTALRISMLDFLC